MRIPQLFCTVLLVTVIGLSGWCHPSEAAPSVPSATSARENGATAIVPNREPLTPLEVALGLDHEVSVKQMNQIAARIHKEGKPGAIGCGIATGADGKMLGDLYGTHYSLKIPGSEQVHEVDVANVRIEKCWSLHSVQVNGFRYRLHDGVFVRSQPPTKKR